MKTLNNDAMNNMDRYTLAVAAFTLIDAMQKMPKEVQLMGAAACFLSISEFYGKPAQDTFTIVKNVINGSEGKCPQFRAIDDYLNGELNDFKS